MQGGEEDDGEASKVSRFKDKNVYEKKLPKSLTPKELSKLCIGAVTLRSYKTKTSYSKGSLVATICLPLAILICVVILFLFGIRSPSFVFNVNREDKVLG